MGSAYRIVDPPNTEQCVEIVGIERHSALKIAARLDHIFGVDAPVEPCQFLKIEVHRIGSRRLLRTARLSGDQLRSQLIGDAGDDLVLHFEEIRGRLVEAVGPKMIAGLRVDKLDINAYAARVALDRASEHVTDAELLADCLGVDGFAFVGEGGVAGGCARGQS